MRAILSVSDKTGLVEFARGLEARGVEIISTGGTFKTLREAGVAVRYVSEITGFPEILGGRVKTLHPAVHGGILAQRSEAHLAELAAQGITPIDLVVVNLYPFRQTVAKADVTLEDAVENIDIGGPSMIRGAAKNFASVTVVVDPADYDAVLERLGSDDRAFRQRLAAKAFGHTAAYDAAITAYLGEPAELPAERTLELVRVQSLRYGENPHQQAALYREGSSRGAVLDAEVLQGKAMSFNNYTDADAAWNLCLEFEAPTCVGVKHANPCAVGTGSSLEEAWTRAYAADPVSIFGGIVAFNRELDEATALAIKDVFLEVILAPAYSEAALAVLGKKKNLRLLRTAQAPRPALDYRRIGGGFVVQQADTLGVEGIERRIVTQRAPTEQEWQDLLFAWRVVKHVKSNAIALAKGGATTGIGVGQVNRIWATQQAIEHAGERAHGSALASDAFFPFDDVVRTAAAAGITALIQPGGSLRDEDSIRAADELGLTMIFTGVRHFRH
ncbi:phosphoribosylaminoimidazolecarboxamide formyltransferase/IMP cyclohydrolase [Deinobacterium chartae]|uniref:Bifunctional purine biosynthesis protein PurH n=1 Tax=Deinobacterium chartae TaxID=521158 RepID=A0A841HY01_9DEIO|nr:bifunctional phosphoribosylaminoimidazolecarboxamide formyltransferase/IMP cyclohydrolase [Deinobacterium chartae]MBB6096675.1 phosphoribosylaminoimidazolecarboxamide formyltransferase/IMP cyclohydrolase [Deinobacterium chartae]